MTGKQYTNPDLLDGAKEAARKAAKKLFKLGIPIETIASAVSASVVEVRIWLDENTNDKH